MLNSTGDLRVDLRGQELREDHGELRGVLLPELDEEILPAEFVVGGEDTIAHRPAHPCLARLWDGQGQDWEKGIETLFLTCRARRASKRRSRR